MSTRQAMEARVLETIERLTPAYQDLLRALVQIPSPAGQEGEAQRLVQAHMTTLGLDVDVFDVEPSRLSGLSAYNQSGRAYEGRPCVVGRWRGAGGGRSLVLNAHIDTVPVDTPERWTHAPFAADVEGGRLFGRGACDDKAGVVECLLVADALGQSGARLAGDLILASVIEDETTGNGTLASVERGHTGDGVIIVDGTWPERFIVSHMGHVSFRVTLHGVAGHATAEGPNPVLAVGRVVDALRAVADRRNSELGRAWGPKARPAFVNIGRMDAGVFSGAIPAQCVIEGQFGFPPPDTCEIAREALVAALRQVASVPAWPLGAPPTLEFLGLEVAPEIGDPQNPLVQLLSATVARRQGAVLQESVIAGHCDLRHYTRARSAPTSAACLYGPGGGWNVHGNDESFELAHMSVVAGNLACVALDWCGVAD